MQSTESGKPESRKRKRSTIRGPGVTVITEGDKHYFVTTGDGRRVEKALFAPRVSRACFSTIGTALRYIADQTAGNHDLCLDLQEAVRRKYDQPFAQPSMPFELLVQNGGHMSLAEWIGDADLFDELTDQKGEEAAKYMARQLARQTRKSKKPKADKVKPRKIVLDGQKTYLLQPNGKLAETTDIKALSSVRRAARSMHVDSIGSYFGNGVLVVGTCDSGSLDQKKANPLADAVFASVFRHDTGGDFLFFYGPVMVTTLKRTTFTYDGK